MTTPAFRAYFLLVALFALWVGAWGYVVPAEVGRALPWPVPPLHARFVAAVYLAGLLAMLLSLRATRLAEVRIPIALAAVWTGMLFLVSTLQLASFDFAKPQVWFWWGAYAVFPLWGAWLYLRGGAGAAARLRPFDPLLAAVAAILFLVGAGLLLAPATMIGLWPWTLPPLLASIYAGPFVAYGIATMMLAREAEPAARRIVLTSLLAFPLLVLLASALHLKLFHFEAPAAWVWFGGLAAAAAVFAFRLVPTLRSAPALR